MTQIGTLPTKLPFGSVIKTKLPIFFVFIFSHRHCELNNEIYQNTCSHTVKNSCSFIPLLHLYDLKQNLKQYDSENMVVPKTGLVLFPRPDHFYAETRANR